MVSFWPWRANDSSPASFEKTLSALSAKITDTQARLDGARATSRRIRVLWSLYLAFAYLVYSIVIFLVVGMNSMGAWEWTGVAGGPVVIYLTRTTVTAFFNYRIDTLSARLKEQQAERAKTIQKLKEATRYDTTLELLEKYGGNEGKGKGRKQSVTDEEKRQQQHQQRRQQGGRHNESAAGGRTNIPPPATANIQRRDGPFPGPASPAPPGIQAGQRPPQTPNGLEPTEEFAPNAYAHPPPPPSQSQHFAQADGTPGSSHWYDRIMDLLLGEDETASKNRIALICANCRLVNGQAPPGTKTLSEIGTWKCMGCGAANGEMDEGKRIMQEVLGSRGGGGGGGNGDGVSAGEEFKESDSDDSDSAVGAEDSNGGVKATGRKGPGPAAAAATTKKRKGKGGK
ncbi:Endoplasmic reticulum junction formation protein lunapark [Colletotrichum shisoi]|uniref:Endoplasmic reticulum junction formation protein lunapark n=1 Tax=Colletotrichum shisoi TaxID=2078593 RepID=A0A5Q4BRF0_9PEZI|nr:Endoplasmic reticulum junction formation protein lunapark [Colletotrichum shisoi]